LGQPTADGSNGAKCRTAPNPEKRGIPNGAKSRRARDARRRPTAAPFRSLSPFGIPRCLGFRAVWDSAPSGIPRRLGFRAVWDFAPFGISRRSGLLQQPSDFRY